MKGNVLSINISEKKGVIKTAVPRAEFRENYGIVGDAHADVNGGKRQVSLLSVTSINKMTEQGIEGLCSGKFAENLTTEGLVLYELPVGTLLQIGDTIQEVSQIGKECHSGCEIMKQVGHCIMPREGIFTKVIKGGVVNVGDEIVVL